MGCRLAVKLLRLKYCGSYFAKSCECSVPGLHVERRRSSRTRQPTGIWPWSRSASGRPG